MRTAAKIRNVTVRLRAAMSAMDQVDALCGARNPEWSAKYAEEAIVQVIEAKFAISELVRFYRRQVERKTLSKRETLIAQALIEKLKRRNGHSSPEGASDGD